jgi:hypothetical protein
VAARATSHAHDEHDALAYLMLAAALAIVALRRGDALVHPAIALPLGVCALVALLCGIASRTRASARLRAAPALMLAGALIAAPPPVYRATQTTLTELFAGERLEFTGTLVQQDRTQALVRYAITCCRADAAPVAVRLARSLPYAAGTWLRAGGVVENAGSDLRLAVQHAERIAPPADPFVYR